jgi:uncharacterized protein
MRVLSIDGGGIRGIIPALVLQEVERRAGRPVFELFDLIAGTSTGAIIACALCAPEPLPASRVVTLYEDEGPEIFARSIFQRIKSANGLLDEKYDSDALDATLARFLADKLLSQTRPDLIVPAYDTARPGPYFFKTMKARASSAAPTYFEPSEVDSRALVDGGVFAVNPAMSAFAEVLRFQPGADVVLLSLGTGQRTRRRSFDQIKDWGLLEWARPLLDVVFDGISDAVDYQLRHALRQGRYWRFQVELTRASDELDDASEENIRRLRAHAEELIAARSEDIDAVIALL